MQITKKMKMAEVIHLNYLLMAVINRFGIELGFGDDTVEVVCQKKGIETAFFLDIVNSYIDENYFPKKHLAGFSSLQIINYLKKTHDYYLKEKIPLLETQIKKLVSSSKAEKSKLKLIEDFFSQYKKELIAHIKREDDVVYPYILELEKFYSDKEKNKPLPEFLKQYSIHNFAHEHDNMEEKLYDLKNILIKYLPVHDDQLILKSILTELFELEKDLYDHARIEDNVLIPKIAELETKVKKKDEG